MARRSPVNRRPPVIELLWLDVELPAATTRPTLVSTRPSVRTRAGGTRFEIDGGSYFPGARRETGVPSRTMRSSVSPCSPSTDDMKRRYRPVGKSAAQGVRHSSPVREGATEAPGGTKLESACAVTRIGPSVVSSTTRPEPGEGGDDDT